MLYTTTRARVEKPVQATPSAVAVARGLREILSMALAETPAGAAAAPAPGQKLFDFGPVLRNRSAMAYAIGYCVHTLEMNALRGWGVAFLG